VARADFYRGELKDRREDIRRIFRLGPGQMVYLQFSLGKLCYQGTKCSKTDFLEPFALF